MFVAEMCVCDYRGRPVGKSGPLSPVRRQVEVLGQMCELGAKLPFIEVITN